MGYFALDLWDLVIEVLHSTKSKTQPKHPGHQETGVDLDSKSKTQRVTRKQKVDQLSGVAPTHILLTMSLSCTFLKTMKL